MNKKELFRNEKREKFAASKIAINRIVFEFIPIHFTDNEESARGKC